MQSNWIHFVRKRLGIADSSGWVIASHTTKGGDKQLTYWWDLPATATEHFSS